VIGGAVDIGRCVPLVASPVRSAVLLCTLPVCRVRVACAWMLVQCCGFVFGFRDLLGLGGLMPSGALFPSKSGLIKKHTVKHTVEDSHANIQYRETRSGDTNIS